MRYILVMLLATFAYSKVLKNSEVLSHQPALQIASLSSAKKIDFIKNQLINEKLFIKKIGNYYVIYIVNFENKKEMFNKKEELENSFSDSITMDKLSDNVYVPQDTLTKIIKNTQPNIPLKSVFTQFKQQKKTPVKSVFNQVKKQDIKSTPSNKTNQKFSNEDVLKYQQAVKFFKTKNYEKSYELFNELFINYLDDEKINFYLGRSAFELEKYNEAYAAYQRVQINNEDNHRVRLEIARILYILKSYDNALKEFEIVLKNPIPTQVRKNVQALIDSIKNKQKKYFFSGVYQLGFGWDNNINNNTHEDFTTYGSTFLTNDTNKVQDSFNKEVLVLNFIRPFKDDKSYAFESSSIFYLQNYSNEYFKNIALI
ncbi:MAG: hypothetical protein HRT43_03325, partial [Campylobacteraceae bacterium]|nr:hypothetical protein [Campylobacteraceae bacterium]